MFIYVLILVIFESIGMSFLTYSHKNNNIMCYIVGSIIYGVVFPFFIYRALSYENISTVNFLSNILSTIIMVGVGYIIFNESINYMKMGGFVLGMFSIVLLYLGT